MTESDTPYTDSKRRYLYYLDWAGSELEAFSRPDPDGEWVDAEVAEKLERENTQLRKKIVEMGWELNPDRMGR